MVDAASFGKSALTLWLIPRSPVSRTETGEQAPTGGVLVRHLGPEPFFPVAGALVAAAILFGLTQREIPHVWRPR